MSWVYWDVKKQASASQELYEAAFETRETYN